MQINFKKQNRQLVIFKMLANANRLKILKAIIASTDGKLNVTSLSKQLKLTPPKISDHLKLMRIHKIVRAKQVGTEMFYSLQEEIIPTLLEDVG